MTIEYAVKAIDDMRGMDCSTRETIMRAVDLYAADPEDVHIRVKRDEESRLFYMELRHRRVVISRDKDDGGRVRVLAVK